MLRNCSQGDSAFSSIPANVLGDFFKRLGVVGEGEVVGDGNVATYMKRLRDEGYATPIIYVGTGTCGLGAGADKTLDAVRSFLAEKNIKATIREVGCIGLCSSEPLLDVKLPNRDRLCFECVDGNMARTILEGIFESNEVRGSCIGRISNGEDKGWDNVPLLSEHPFFKSQMRWALSNCGLISPTDIREAVACGCYGSFLKAIHTMTQREVCDEVLKSGLRGRGGGGFPTGKKWELALQSVADAKYLICNADEGDPGAFMDRALIEGDPHRLIEGLAIASYAIGARTAYIYIRAEYPLAIKRLETAIADAKSIGIISDNVFDSGFGINIKIKEGAGAFVCGEETALIHSIEGKRGMPRPRPPYPVKSGLFGKPTVINNVETFANVPLVVAGGGDSFAKVGTATSKGTKVFALSGKIARTGLVEVPMGTSLSNIVFEIGGGVPFGKTFKAVQIGGPSGGCIPAEKMDVQVDYESLKTLGAMMGSGGLVVMDEDTCMVDVAKFFMDFIQKESCGKCIPCREGTKAMLEILSSITRGRRSEKGVDALERFQGIIYLTRLAEVIRETSLCGLGQSAPNPVLSTLRWFRKEYETHIFERKCPAGACSELVSYSIDESLCKGCTLCVKKCPSGAIKGAVKSPHYVIQEKCIACGACKAVCKFNAVIVS